MIQSKFSPWIQRGILGLAALFFFILTLLISYEVTIHTIHKTPPQQATISYLLSDTALPPHYTPNEIDHLQDVKQITSNITFAFYSLMTVLISLIILLVYLTKKTLKVKEKAQTLILSIVSKISMLSIILGLLFTLIIIINFNLAFTYFHYLLFPQGNWQFPYDSQLITTFPEAFFNTITIRIAIITVLLQLIAPITMMIIKRRNSQKVKN